MRRALYTLVAVGTLAISGCGTSDDDTSDAVNDTQADTQVDNDNQTDTQADAPTLQMTTYSLVSQHLYEGEACEGTSEEVPMDGETVIFSFDESGSFSFSMAMCSESGIDAIRSEEECRAADGEWEETAVSGEWEVVDMVVTMTPTEEEPLSCTLLSSTQLRCEGAQSEVALNEDGSAGESQSRCMDLIFETAS
jgi:hypothetical protein